MHQEDRDVDKLTFDFFLVPTPDIGTKKTLLGFHEDEE
jgi:hypothetical protein